MNEIWRPLSLCFLFFALSTSVLCQEKKTEEIKGVVVAEYRGMLAHACYHVCGLSLLVKLDKPVSDQYVVVQVEYMDVHSLPRNGLPVRLVEKATRWKFEATIETGGTASLQRYMKIIDQNGKDVSEKTAIPAWDLLKGAENEKLPYRESLTTYRVKVGKFKLVK